MARSSRIQISASIVVFKNPPAQLEAAVQSVQSAMSNVAVTVLDNSPLDDLRAVAEGCGADYRFLGDNLGFGKAHNFAIRKYLPVSQYHLVLNPDVRFQGEVLDTLAHFMDINPNVGLVMPKVLYPDSSEQHLCKLVPHPVDLLTRRFLPSWLVRKRLSRYTMECVDFGIPRFVPVLSGCFMFLRMSVLRRVGTFDERYFMYLEDVDLCRRIATVSDTVFFPHVAIQHEYGKGSYLSWRLLRYHLNSAWRYFRKWGWLMDSERDRLNHRAFENEIVYQNSSEFRSSSIEKKALGR